MEPSEDFAFSGPKYKTLQLLPLSRQTVRYNLIPSVWGEWIAPQLIVMDQYFNKRLRVSATEGMRSEKKGGVLVWVPSDLD
jgi:solute carrier family 25 protein 38